MLTRATSDNTPTRTLRFTTTLRRGPKIQDTIGNRAEAIAMAEAKDEAKDEAMDEAEDKAPLIPSMSLAVPLVKL
jgi:hypothetical protein